MPPPLCDSSCSMTDHFSFEELASPTASFYQRPLLPRLALLGASVAHSRSPEIHNTLLKKFNLPWSYIAIDVQAEELASSFTLLRQKHFVGFNITMPHKQAALALVDEVSNHAALLGAINTVVINNGKFYGSNTDGPGFVAALQEEWNYSLEGRSLLILGATGGAGSALAVQAALEGCRQLFLASRTPTDLNILIRKLNQLRPDLIVAAVSWEHAALAYAMKHAELIIKATPVEIPLFQETTLTPALSFEPRHYVYDLGYSSKRTPFIEYAKASGARATDGTSLLRHQAMLSFNTWLHYLEHFK